MKTIHYTREDIASVAGLLQRGALIAIPTDTVFGLAIKSSSADTYERLKRVKGRPDSKPFPLMVNSIEQLRALVYMDEMTEHLVKTWMPGAVTFIFRKKEQAFGFLGSQKTLGIRMADDPWVKSLIDALGEPLWLPSANKSGEPTGTTAEMVLDQLAGEIEGIVVGEVRGGHASSVFDISQLPEIVELRSGPISLESLKKSTNSL